MKDRVSEQGWLDLFSKCQVGELPLSFPRSSVQTFTRGEVLHRLQDSVGLAGDGTVSLDLIAAGIAAVLCKYSGQYKIRLGVLSVPNSGGMSRLLPVCAELAADASLESLPVTMTEALKLAEQYGGPSKSELSGGDSAGSQAIDPLFRVLVVMESAEVAGDSMADELDAYWEQVQSCDLVIHVSLDNGTLLLRGDYDADVLESRIVEAFMGHVEVVTTAIVATGDVELARLSILSEPERQRILKEWNNTETEFPHVPSLHAMFEARAASHPDSIALLWHNDTVSYKELNESANRLAHWLRDRGVAPDKPVGVLLDRSPEMVVALYGILKSGGCYLPIDPEYPLERVRFMLSDAETDIVLTCHDHVSTLPDGLVTLCLDGKPDCLAEQDSCNPELQTGLDHAAYIIYTSGSTGQPKGVINSHRGICNRLFWMQSEYELGESDTVLQKTPFTFDVSVWEFFWPLMQGARLAILPPGHHRDSSSLVEHIERLAVTTLHFVPSMLQLFVDEPSLGRCHSLRRVVCSGEALPVPLQERFFECLPDVELHNLYGPTEAAIDVSYWRCRPGELRDSVPIGRPVANTRLYILDEFMQPVAAGVPGELHIGGVQVASGYLNRPELTSEKFISDPFSTDANGRLYKTGDLARFLPDGNIEFLGRIDHQVKLRGLRIELGEIEAQLGLCEGIRESVVTVREDTPGDQRLVAYVVARSGEKPDLDKTNHQLRRVLPDFMVPNPIVVLDAMPLNSSGKVDRAALPMPGRALRAVSDTGFRSRTEETIASIWSDLLGLDEVGLNENFFDLGGHSVLVARLRSRLEESFDCDLAMSEMFRHTTVASLAQRIDGGKAPASERVGQRRTRAAGEIAVVGLACRLPGARDADEFWLNLENGIESVTFFSDEELREAGISQDELDSPGYVRARAILEDADLFDAAFFGYSPREAEVIAPEQRIFLETAWIALEDAGYSRDDRGCTVGVYAGTGMNTYLMHNLHERARNSGAVGAFQVMISNDKDFLPTRVSYKLNLKGPSVNVQTACSTSAVAIHTACRALVEGECDMALAGGVTVHVPQFTGYQYQEGMILSSDGHCRAFDSRADGTVFGSGVAVLALKPLENALADGDRIHAIIKGTAINNDGSGKIGFTAPSVAGQSEVIMAAHAQAGVSADSISYVEAHGTGTALGDPIEIEALKEAFGHQSDDRGYCGIGSVKTNIGHVDAAAGAAGVIKTILALKNKKIAPSLHFEAPNPEIDFENSPFYVVRQAKDWPRGKTPRRAGVSSFGIGGTNAHLVLEEAPEMEGRTAGLDRDCHLLNLSAKTDQALIDMAASFANRFAGADSTEAADICFTANATRPLFDKRLAVVGADGKSLSAALSRFAEQGADRCVHLGGGGIPGKIAFLMTGQGAQQPGMGAELYHSSPVFRQELERCASILDQYLDVPLLDVMHVDAESEQGSLLHDTRFTQPALFAFEYAMAQLWKSWGVTPDIVMGHSVGEYVAACIAGVFSLEDGLKLIAHRGRLMSALPQNGEMLAVMAAESEVSARISGHLDKISLAAVNGPDSCVISGDRELLHLLGAEINDSGIETRTLKVSHAFHSPLMEPILAEFLDIVRDVPLSTPEIGLISNVSGNLATEEVTRPEYWVQHLREPVRFLDGIRSLEEAGCELFVECGPQPTLVGMGRFCARSEDLHWIASRRDGSGEWEQLLRGLGELVVQGMQPDWLEYDGPYNRRRVGLPPYPFQRERYWVEEQAFTRDEGDGAHVLLGRQVSLPMSSEVRYQTSFSLNNPPYVKDHRIFGVLVVAGASHCSLLLQGATELLGNTLCTIEEIYFLQPFVLSEEGKGLAQLIISSEDSGSRQMQLVSLGEGENPNEQTSWKQHVRAQLRVCSDAVVGREKLNVETIRERCSRHLSHDEFYQDFWVQGPDAGPSFRWIEDIWMGSDEAMARTTLPDLEEDPAEFQLHPGIIEACFQVLRGCREFESQTLLASGGYIYVPFSIGQFQLLRKPEGNCLWCYASIRDDSNEHSVIGDLILADESGKTLAVINAFECRRLPQETLLRHLHADTRDWLYQVNWKPLDLPQPAATTGGGVWLILADESGVGDVLATELEAAGHTSIVAYPGDSFWVDTNGDYHVDPMSPQDFVLLIDGIGESLGKHSNVDPIQGIINLWGLIGGPPADLADLSSSMRLGGASTLHLIQAITNRKWKKPPEFWLASKGAQAAGSCITNVAQSPLWGLARVLVQEHPEIRVRCVDLCPVDDKEGVPLLVRDLLQGDEEDQIAYREGQRLVPRLVRYRTRDDNGSLSPVIRQDATYLITGWAGGIGLRLVRRLVEAGARHLLLCGRRQPDGNSADLLRSLNDQGIETHAVTVDVGDAEATAEMLNEAAAHLPPLAGIFHIAGTLDDGLLAQQNWERFLTVFRPKVLGTWNLHQLTREYKLDFFVCFSSASGLLGAQGQGNYAAANAFMDSLMEFRHANGLPGLSIDWGPWAEVGMAAALGDREQRRSTEQGWSRIEPEVGLNILEELLSSRVGRVAVLPLHWGRFSHSLFEGHLPPFLRGWQPQNNDRTGTSSVGAAADAGADVLNAPAEKREDRLRDYVIRVVADLLGHEEVDPQQGFTEMGMDSLMSVDMRAVLQKSLKVSLASTFAFDYPNVDDVVRYLMSELFEEDGGGNSGSSRDKVLKEDGPELHGIEIDESVEAELAALERELGRGND